MSTKIIAGPDPNPTKPKITLPPNACDAHCHIFGPASKFPYHPDRAYTPPDAGKEALRKLHDFLGIERAVIVHASCHGVYMDATLDGIATSNGKYRGTSIVSPEITDKELQRYNAGGIRAVRFNFVKHLESVPEHSTVTRMADRIKDMGWHLVVHLDAENLVELSPLLRGLPVPFVIDHMARVKTNLGLEQPAFQTLLELMKDEKSWVKVSGPERLSVAGPPFTDAIPFAKALIQVAPSRILWGTDFPHPNVKHMPNDGHLVDLLGMMAPDPATLKTILVDNPTRLYWAG